MKYEKPEVEVVKFDSEGFMTGSMNGGSCSGYSDGHGHTCGTYTAGSSCTGFTSSSFGGATCNSFTGNKCYNYTDSNHPATNPCTDFGYTCSKF